MDSSRGHSESRWREEEDRKRKEQEAEQERWRKEEEKKKKLEDERKRNPPIDPPPGPHLMVRPVPPTRSPPQRDSAFQASIGVIADIQYGEKANSTVDRRTRLYRDALFKLDHSLSYFREVHRERPLRGVLHLGDIVDGRWEEDGTLADFEAICRKFEDLGELPQWHVIGNHCLDVGRPYLMQRLFGCRHNVAWYEVQISDEWRMCVLDTTEVGVDGATSMHRVQARQWQSQNWRRPEGQHWNSMVGDEQLNWLNRRILASRAEGKHVVVVGHHPVNVLAADKHHVAWEYEKLQRLLEDNCDVVKAYWAGHWHVGGYIYENGIHHVTWSAIVEAWDNAYSVVDFYSDRIDIMSHGQMYSIELPVRSFTYEDAELPAADGSVKAQQADHSAGLPVVCVAAG